MGTKYKFLKYTLASSLLMPLSFGSTLSNVGDTIDAVSTVAAAVTQQAEFNLGNSTQGAAEATPMIVSVTVNDNSADGFTVSVDPANGFYQNTSTSGADDGDKINYKMQCTALSNSASDTITNNYSSATNITSGNSVNIYSASTVTVPTCSAASGHESPCIASPTCTFTVTENPNEGFAGDYTETLVFAIS